MGGVQTRLSPVNSEHKIVQGASVALALVSRMKLPSSSAWISLISQGQRRHGHVCIWNGEDIPRLVREDASHLVNVDSPACGLEGEARRGQSEIVLSDTVGPVVTGEGLPGTSKGKSRGFPCPGPIAFNQTSQHLLEFLFPITVRDEVTPWLFIK